MTDVEFSRLISDLSTTAKRLNEASDSLNDLIGQLEDRLREINAGVEVWLTQWSISSDRWTEEDEQDSRIIRSGIYQRELGFARADKKWHLLVRTATYERNAYDSLEFVSADDGELLSATSRKVRIEGLKRVPGLVEAMKREADEALKTIEEAKKLVK